MAVSNLQPSTLDTENPQIDLLHALSALLVSGGKYSDLKITCNYRQWAVHRAIICPRSGFFDGACSSHFLEASSGTIDLSEDDEEAVEHMINFFYHLDYLNQPAQPRPTIFRHRARSDARRKLPKKYDLSHIEDPLMSMAGCYVPQELPTPPPSSPATSPRNSRDLSQYKFRPSSPSGVQTPPPELDSDNGSDCDMSEREEDDDLAEEVDSHLLLHTRVYALAEKYDIPSLKALAKRKFEMAMACYYDAPELAQAIEEVYCSTIDSDRGLRDTVLEAFKSHPRLANTQDVYEVIQETPSLALELFKVERGIPV